MGVLRTVGIAVCVVSGVAGDETATTWVNLHQAGFEAFGAGRFNEALSDFTAALALATGSSQRAASLNDIGNSLRGLGRDSEALEKLGEALRMWREIDAAGPHAAETAVSVANAQRALERHMAAEQTLREALDAHPRDAPGVAGLSNALGDLLREQDRLREARTNFERALNLSPEAEIRRLDALLGLADVERAESQFQSAVAHWNEGLAIARQLGDRALEGLALRGLGKTYLDSGDLARAEPLLKRALAILDAIPALANQSAATLACLGVVYRDQKKLAMAEETLTKSLNMQGGFEHGTHPQAAVTMQLLAGVFANENRSDIARNYAERALRIMESEFPSGSPPIAGALGTTAFVEQRSGDLAASARHYSEAIQIMRRNGVAESDMGAEFMTEYASVLRRLHRGSDARVLESEAKSFRQSVR